MLKKPSKHRTAASKIKAGFVVILLVLSLGLILGIMQIPQDIRQRAQNTPARDTTPPQCLATGGQPNTGVCVPVAEGCLPGEEQNGGQLDCTAGQTCCSLVEVPEQCAAQSSGQTFCSTATNCTTLYNSMNLGQFDCGEGHICCKNPTFPTTAPTPTATLEPTEPADPTQVEDPTPTFGSISVPTEEPTPAPGQNPQTPTASNESLIAIILVLITLILRLFGF